jgi:iron complex transport system ATP-binding protein
VTPVGPARLEARGLSAGYGAKLVLEGVSCALPRGRVAALLGENGSGKSTLLRVLAGILKPRAGEVRLDGRELASVPRREAACTIGYLPQGFEPLFPMTALELVLLGRTPHLGPLGAPGAADRAAAASALDEMDAGALADADIRAMSGGERQRVLLARVLAGGPSVLLLDEPTANLDPRHRFCVLDAVRRRADAGGTVLFSTHELDVAAQGADDAVLLAGRRVLAAGPLEATLTGTLLSELFAVAASVSPGPGGRPLVSFGSEPSG